MLNCNVYVTDMVVAPENSANILGQSKSTSAATPGRITGGKDPEPGVRIGVPLREPKRHLWLARHNDHFLDIPSGCEC